MQNNVYSPDIKTKRFFLLLYQYQKYGISCIIFKIQSTAQNNKDFQFN